MNGSFSTATLIGGLERQWQGKVLPVDRALSGVVVHAYCIKREVAQD